LELPPTASSTQNSAAAAVTPQSSGRLSFRSSARSNRIADLPIVAGQVQERGLQTSMLAGQLGDAALLHQPAGVQHRDPVAHLLDLGQQVAGEEHRGAAVRQRAEHRAELADAGGVHAVGRLVQQQQRGVAQQRGREPEALAHALRVRLDLAAGDRGQRDLVQGDLDGVPARQRRPAEREHLEIAPAAEPRVEGGLLDHRADPGQPVGVGQRSPVEPGSARAGPDQPEQHPHGGGLADKN